MGCSASRIKVVVVVVVMVVVVVVVVVVAEVLGGDVRYVRQV